jgi:perosamine synthetase
MARAHPVLVDVAADTFCLDAQTVRAQGSNVDAIVAVHTFGAPADIDSLRVFGVPIIEDCCQAIGGTDTDTHQLLGSRGDAAVFSFYATKIIAAGQGGLVWSGTPSVIESVRDYREFDGCKVYEPRFNFQLTEMQAALAYSQFKRIDAIRARRAAVAAAYRAAIPAGFHVQSSLTASGRMVQRFVLLAPDRQTRDALRSHLLRQEVGCIVPVETFELLHRYLRLDPLDFPVAERLADTALSLPMHAGLSDRDVAEVCSVLKAFEP